MILETEKLIPILQRKIPGLSEVAARKLIYEGLEDVLADLLVARHWNQIATKAIITKYPGQLKGNNATLNLPV